MNDPNVQAIIGERLLTLAEPCFACGGMNGPTECGGECVGVNRPICGECKKALLLR